MTGRHHRHQEPHQTLQLTEDELKAPGEWKISLQFSCLKWEHKIFISEPEYLHVQ